MLVLRHANSIQTTLKECLKISLQRSWDHITPTKPQLILTLPSLSLTSIPMQHKRLESITGGSLVIRNIHALLPHSKFASELILQNHVDVGLWLVWHQLCSSRELTDVVLGDKHHLKWLLIVLLIVL